MSTVAGTVRGDRLWAVIAGAVALLTVALQPTAPLLLALTLLALVPWLVEAVRPPLPLGLFTALAVLPVLVAVAVTGYGTVLFLLTLAGSRVASRTDQRTAVAGIAVIGCGAPVLALLRHAPDPGMVYFAVGDCFGVLLGVLLRRTIHLAEDLRAADARLAESAGRAERERIARDVHDLVAHSLTVVVLHVGGARRVLRADPAAAERALEDAERVCRESLDGIRGVVGLLRGDDDSSVLSLDLEALAATYRAAGVPVALAVSGDPTTLPLVTRVTLYRVLQEAFANAARHSGPGAVVARITATADSVMVSVENPLGVARPGAPGTGGFGLAGLREQVAAQAGELSGGPEGGAWVVRCRLPVASPSPVSAGSP